MEKPVLEKGGGDGDKMIFLCHSVAFALQDRRVQRGGGGRKSKVSFKGVQK